MLLLNVHGKLKTCTVIRSQKKKLYINKKQNTVYMSHIYHCLVHEPLGIFVSEFFLLLIYYICTCTLHHI